MARPQLNRGIQLKDLSPDERIKILLAGSNLIKRPTQLDPVGGGSIQKSGGGGPAQTPTPPNITKGMATEVPRALSTEIIHPRVARLVEERKNSKYPVDLANATRYMNAQFRHLEPLAQSFGKSVDDLIDMFVSGVNKIMHNEEFLRARRGPMTFEPNTPFQEALERLQEGTNIKIMNEAANALNGFVVDDLGPEAARRR